MRRRQCESEHQVADNQKQGTPDKHGRTFTLRVKEPAKERSDDGGADREPPEYVRGCLGGDSGELLSLNKMLGSLQDAGNTSTLSGYLNLLAESGLLCGLQKYSIDMARRRASIPKLQVYNNALKTVYSPIPFNQAVLDRKSWGRIFESGVGAYLVSQAFVHRFDVFYWRERNDEVDFILRKKNSLVAIEVKGNAEKRTEGLNKFRELFKPTSSFIVGDGGIKAEEFMSMDLMKLF